MHPNMDKWIIPVYGPRPVTLSRLFAKATRSHYSCLSLCLTLMMDSLLPIWAFLDLWLGQPCAKIIHPCTWGVCCVVHAEHCHSQVQGVFPVGCVEGVHGSSDRQSGGHPTTAHRVPHAQSASQSCPESCSLKQSHFWGPDESTNPTLTWDWPVTGVPLFNCSIPFSPSLYSVTVCQAPSLILVSLTMAAIPVPQLNLAGGREWRGRF